MKNASRIIVLVTLLNLGASICSARTNAKDSSASISGRVTIAGKAAADISVTASIVSGYERRGIAKATTDEDGNYRLSGLSPGRLFVTPVAKAHVISAGEFTRGQPGRNGGGSVRGTIKLAGGILPEGALFWVLLSGKQDGMRPFRRHIEVDSRGRFSSENIPTGTYELTLNVAVNHQEIPGLAPVKQTITITNGVETQVNLEVNVTGRKEGSN